MLQCDVVVGDGVFFLAEKAGNAANASKSLGWVGADPADYANFYGLVKVKRRLAAVVASLVSVS